MKLQSNKKLKIIRSYFPITKKKLYFANANYFPVPKPVLKEVIKELKKKKYGKLYENHFNEYLEKTKGQIASLYYGDKNKFIFYRNSTELLLFILILLKKENILRDNNEILTYKENFPSHFNLINSLSKALNIKIRKFEQNNNPIGEKILSKNISKNTKIFVFSSVDFISGTRNYLEEIGKFLKRKNIISIADITQQIGLYPFSLDKFDIDFYIASFHKGFMGLDGGAFGYFKTYPIPPFIGWRNFYNSDENPTFTEEASFDILPVSSISGSINFIKKLTFNKIVKYNARNWHYFLSFFKELKNYENKNFKIITPIENQIYINQFNFENKDYYYKYPSSIFSLKILNEKTKNLLKDFFSLNNIEINFFGNILRISFSFYNSKEEIEILTRGLKNILLK